jgi:cytochrome oxidase assembly protein ShyY1
MSYVRKSYKRWLAWLLLASAFAVACGYLSNWQFHRRADRVAQIAIVEQNYNAHAVAAEKLLLGNHNENELLWHPVTLSGRYLNDKMLLVRNRPQSGQPGFEQVIPFDSTVGTFLVDRGWLPTGNLQDSPDRIPLPIENAQLITVRLMLSEKSLNRDAPKGQVAEINLDHIARLSETPIDTKWYGQLVSNNVKTLPLQLTKPSTDEGNHLSYAFQWIMFALMAFAFLVWAVRKEIEFAKSQSDPDYQAPAKKTSRASIDAQAEDE